VGTARPNTFGLTPECRCNLGRLIYPNGLPSPTKLLFRRRKQCASNSDFANKWLLCPYDYQELAGLEVAQAR